MPSSDCSVTSGDLSFSGAQRKPQKKLFQYICRLQMQAVDGEKRPVFRAGVLLTHKAGPLCRTFRASKGPLSHLRPGSCQEASHASHSARISAFPISANVNLMGQLAKALVLSGLLLLH